MNRLGAWVVRRAEERNRAYLAVLDHLIEAGETTAAGVSAVTGIPPARTSRILRDYERWGQVIARPRRDDPIAVRTYAADRTDYITALRARTLRMSR